MKAPDYYISIEGVPLPLEEFQNHKLSASALGKLFLAVLKEKNWSRGLAVGFCTYNGQQWLDLRSEMFTLGGVLPGSFLFEPTDQQQPTMEALQNAMMMAFVKETISIDRQEQSLKRRSMLLARLRKAVHLELVFDTLKAKASSGRVHPPARKDDVWYAINGNRMLVMREVDLDRKVVYALERMTKKQFEDERIHPPPQVCRQRRNQAVTH